MKATELNLISVHVIIGERDVEYKEFIDFLAKENISYVKEGMYKYIFAASVKDLKKMAKRGLLKDGRMTISY